MVDYNQVGIRSHGITWGKQSFRIQLKAQHVLHHVSNGGTRLSSKIMAKNTAGVQSIWGHQSTFILTQDICTWTKTLGIEFILLHWQLLKMYGVTSCKRPSGGFTVSFLQLQNSTKHSKGRCYTLQAKGLTPTLNSNHISGKTNAHFLPPRHFQRVHFCLQYLTIQVCIWLHISMPWTFRCTSAQIFKTDSNLFDVHLDL